MGYVLACNCTILAISTLSATSGCIVMRVAAASSIRKSARGAHLMRRAAGRPCAYSKPLSLHMGHVRKSSLCQRTLWCSPCIRLTWQTQIPASSSINRILRRFAAQDIWTKHLVAVLEAWSRKTRYCITLSNYHRVVSACLTWIVPQLILLSSPSANAGTLPREPSIAISREVMMNGWKLTLW